MMKNIFIVTDFSEASKNAGLYGIELAKLFDANVILFNAYQTPVQIPESYIFFTPEDVCESTKLLLKQEAVMINPGNKVNMEIYCAEGLPSDTIIAEAIKRESDLIICGMKGIAKAFRKIFGSTTSALTRKSEIPLIVVPENAGFHLPKNIALASDLDPETSPATVDLLKVLGEKFTSKIAIVWVVDDDFNAVKEMRYRTVGIIKELKNLDPVFEFPTGSSIPKTLESFVKEHDIQLLAIIPHKHDLLERFFTESLTKEMIFHSHIPLLVLPQKKNGHPGNQINMSQVNQTHG